MEQIVFDAPGTPDALYMISLDTPTPSKDQVLVETAVVGVNYIDVYRRSGKLPEQVGLRSGIGVESVGRIAAIGSGVTNLQVGERVAMIGGAPSSYSTHRLFHKDRIVKLPDDISDEDAAALLFKGLTVEYLINRCVKVKAGQNILWHAAAGGVGRIAGQWLATRGVNLIGTVGHPRKVELAKSFGFTSVLLSNSASLTDEVTALTDGQGIDITYDGIGNDTFDVSLSVLKSRGTLVLFGNTSGKVDGFDTSRLGSEGSVYLTRPSIAHYIADNQELQMAASAVFEAIRNGTITSGKINKFNLQDAASAHLALERRDLIGSTILLV